MPALNASPQLILQCLTGLGFTAKHQLIRALRANQNIDLNTPDEYGFTPLRLAIQKQDIELIKKLYSLEPQPKYLSAYDRRFIDEVVSAQDNSFKALPLPEHGELISCIQYLYSSDAEELEGVCFGLIHMRRQAFLLGEMDVFQKRLKNIKSNLLPLIDKVKSNVQSEGINPHTQAQQFFTRVQEELKKQLPYPIWYDIYAFFDGVFLYHTTDKFSELFVPQKAAQTLLNAEPLLRPIQFEINKVTPVPAEYVFSGHYTAITLAIYFECLDLALKNMNIPVSFELLTGNHAINVDYSNGVWILTDANYLEEGEKEYNSKEIAQLLLTWHSSPFIFSTRAFTTSNKIELLNQSLTSLKENLTWNELHENITKEQIIQKDSFGHTLFYIAASRGDLETVKQCIALGGTCNPEGEEAATPFFIAAKEGHLEVVKVLIQEFGNDKEQINQSAENGVTPLWAAAKYGHLEIVEILIQEFRNDKEKINQPSHPGATPLLVAAEQGQLKIVAMLIQALENDKEQINKPMNQGITPLYMAAQNGHLEIVKVLIQTIRNDKEQINKPANNGITPLFIAAQNGHLEIVKVLIQALGNDKEKINQPMNQGATPLFAAAQNGHLGLVKVLVEALGNDKEKINQPLMETTPIFTAAEQGHLEIVKVLIRALENDKEKINQPINQGATPLYIAAQNGHLEIVKALIQALGNDKEKMNQPANNGITPLSIAEQKGHAAIVKILREALERGQEKMSQSMNCPDLARSNLNVENEFKLINELLDEASSQEEHADIAKEILKQQKNTYPQYIQKIKKLYEQIESINNYTANLTVDNTKKVSSLSIQLKKELDLLIIQHPTQLPDETAFNQFKRKFNHRLHSEDIIMSQQESWNSFAPNLFLGVITLGIALGIKAIHSKLTTDHMTLFARKTKKQEQIDTLQEVLESVCALS